MEATIDETMHHPLFVEPTDDIVHSDPYSGPLGFMLGGMALPTKLELSQQYFDAGNALIEVIKQHRCEDFRLVNPVLFLYRHALELILKWLMKSKAKHHKLDILASDFEKFIRDHYDQETPAWITNRLKEFAKIDPNSMAFRYAEDKYLNSKTYSEVDGEVYVGVIHLQQAMKTLYEILATVAGKIE